MLFFNKRNRHFSKIIQNIKAKNRGGPKSDLIFYLSTNSKVKFCMHLFFVIFTTIMMFKRFSYFENCFENGAVILSDITNWALVSFN